MQLVTVINRISIDPIIEDTEQNTSMISTFKAENTIIELDPNLNVERRQTIWDLI